MRRDTSGGNTVGIGSREERLGRSVLATSNVLRDENFAGESVVRGLERRERVVRLGSEDRQAIEPSEPIALNDRSRVMRLDVLRVLRIGSWPRPFEVRVSVCNDPKLEVSSTT